MKIKRKIEHAPKEYRLIPGTMQPYLVNLDFFVNGYIIDRINDLKECIDDTTSKIELIEAIFADFFDIYEYDCSHSITPELFGCFDTKEAKNAFVKKKLLVENFNLYLGTIFCNFHEWLYDNSIFPDIYLSKFVTDFGSLYDKAVLEYLSVLKKKAPQYYIAIHQRPLDCSTKIRIDNMRMESPIEVYKTVVTNYIMPSLIETYIKEYIQQAITDEGIKRSRQAFEDGKLGLSDEEYRIAAPFYRDELIPTNKEFALCKMYNIFTRNHVLKDTKENRYLMTGISNSGKHSPVMLSGLLRNRYLDEHVLPEHLKIMRLLFYGEKLNIRNSVMHGTSNTFDPFAICYGSIMLQIFWRIIDKTIFFNSGIK